MELIKRAKLNLNKHIERTQCGWKFNPRVCLLKYINLETPFDYQCNNCNQTLLIDNFEEFCEKCYECYVYPHTDEIKNKIYNFDVEILEQKDTDYLDMSTYYKIKVNEFYGTMFCGEFKEPNEWSSSPHDDYWHITFLFTDSESCDNEYKTMKELIKNIDYCTDC